MGSRSDSPHAQASAARGRAAPRFSIIVPAYNVQAYLRECLDSILGQSFDDFEVVAVDDRSPDGCGRIFDEYAAADARIRVLHLDENVGLGLARQAGLDVATGDYILFVDSDDTLTPDALRAISARLGAVGCPDVLVFDYARSYWWGKVQRNQLAELLMENDPQVFSVDERPELLSLLMVVWNKAYRREFIARYGFRFSPGFYEDTPWTYPTLLGAGRVAVLDRVCLHYRQRRQGSILRSRSRKHFDAFDQYERVLAFLDEHPELEHWRAFLFGRAIQHYLTILANPHRVPRAARAEFFHRAASFYRRFEPPGGVTPGDRHGRLKFRLVARDLYWAYETLRLGRQAAVRSLGAARTYAKRARKGAGRIRARLLRAYYRVQLRLPVDEHLAVYAAYWYRSYGCNPAAIYEKGQELVPSIHGVWVIARGAEDALPAGTDYVVANTRRYYRVLARAKYLINNVNFPNDVIKRADAVHVQTHHGTPLKSMGLDLQWYPVANSRMSFRNLLARSDRWDYSISSNRFSTEVWERVYPCDYVSLEAGYPRNDRLCNASDADVGQARARLGLATGQTAVLYTPTFREYQQNFEPVLDLARLAQELGTEFVLLVRAHYFYPENQELQALQRDGKLRDVSGFPSIEELCLAGDVLLTDYSSIMFDYANLDRPIVIYAHDWDTYVRTRGVYFDLLAEPPGAVATNEDDLVKVFTSGAAWNYEATQARAAFRRRFCEFDDGRASERVVRRVLLGEED